MKNKCRFLTDDEVIAHYDKLLVNDYKFCPTDLMAPSILGRLEIIKWFYAKQGVGPRSLTLRWYQVYKIPPPNITNKNFVCWSIDVILSWLCKCNNLSSIRSILEFLYQSSAELRHVTIGQELRDDFFESLIVNKCDGELINWLVGLPQFKLSMKILNKLLLEYPKNLKLVELFFQNLGNDYPSDWKEQETLTREYFTAPEYYTADNICWY